MPTDQSTLNHPIGQRLRAARESKSLSLVDIAGTLRIKPVFLEALESDRPEALPSPTHASGFLRTYARYLGVELAAATITPPPVMTPLAPTAAVPNRLAVILPPLLIIGGLILLYALWQWLKAPESAPIAPPPADLGMQTVPPKLEPLEPKLEPKTEPKVEVAPAVVAPVAAETVPATTEVAKPVTKVEPVKSETLVVRAVSDAWVQITDAKGAQLYSRLMRAGESWRAPQQAGLKLSTGNASGLVLVQNGEASAPLGTPAQVLRNLPLNDASPVVKPASIAKPAPVAADTTDVPGVEE